MRDRVYKGMVVMLRLSAPMKRFTDHTDQPNLVGLVKHIVLFKQMAFDFRILHTRVVSYPVRNTSKKNKKLFYYLISLLYSGTWS